ncbi:MAG: hypothetical protein HY459_02475, partial [Parcubacteria group bacterium]|nr:hypothetical protein [Parcubacteria group bacterium]
MRFRSTRSVLLVTLLVLFAGMQILPELQVVKEANAVHGGNLPILGLFNEQRKSNAVIDPGIQNNNLFQMDVNITDAGPWKSFDINLTFTSALAFAGSSFKAPGCPASQGCLFDGKTTFIPVGGNVSGTGFYRFTAVNTDTSTPYLSGTGIIFRVWFKAVGNSGQTAITIKSSSIIQNPAILPYKPIHGYFDSGTTLFDYPFTRSTDTATVLRTVSGTNSTPSVTVTLGTPVGTAQPVTLSAIGLPTGATAAFSPSSSCTPSCTRSLTITVTGGPSGATRTPSGNYSIAIL